MSTRAEILDGNHTDEEIQLALQIGQRPDSLTNKVMALFRELRDPLLSADDVLSLLGNTEKIADLQICLGALVASGDLESTTTTQRPFDAHGIALYRAGHVSVQRLLLFGLETRLEDGTSLIQFSCEGRLIRNIARVDRLDAVAGEGNQRAEIYKHVKSIAAGIESGTQVPNPVLLVLLEGAVSRLEQNEPLPEGTPRSQIFLRPLSGDFRHANIPGEEGSPAQSIRTVALEFPWRRAAFDEEKSAMLVDGQQRTAALSLVSLSKVRQFTLSVSALIAGGEAAKKIFLVANSTQKIDVKFSRALLAAMVDAPGFLREERPKVFATKKLALDLKDSPFYEISEYPGATVSKKIVAYNSLFQIVSEFSEGPFKDELGDPKDIDGVAVKLADIVSQAFGIVARTWPVAWGKKPKHSKLMNGAGLRAMTALLIQEIDYAFRTVPDLRSKELWSAVEAKITKLKTVIVWSPDELNDATEAAKKNLSKIQDWQNTPQDIKEFTKFLLHEMTDVVKKEASRKKGRA